MPNLLKIALKNDSDHPTLHAYVTGLAIQHNNARCLLKSVGHDLYFPSEPPEILSPLEEDCAIPLGPPGNTVHISIPQIAGGRIWIAEGHLTFLLNPSGDPTGPALVEPSVLNPSDVNAGVNFGFCEFTLNDAQLYANISYVDFVPRIPIAISLQRVNGEVQHVAGMAPDGLDRLAEDMGEQSRKDGQPWEKLVVNRDGRNLRILNATHGNAVGANFDGYFEKHIDEVWHHYSHGTGRKMRINTQAASGIVEGHINKRGDLVIAGEHFSKPTTADVLGCNSGPFTTGPSATRNAIIPRLAAAFVRSSLLDAEEQPSHPSTFYKREPTNHYARLVHEHNVDGKGYAFAYDDVQMDGGEDQSGKVNAGDPDVFTVSVGGKSAAANPKYGRAHSQHDGGSETYGTYERGPPPPPPRRDDGDDTEHGWRGKMHGLAKKMMQ